jgi:hypothetical protein
VLKILLFLLSSLLLGHGWQRRQEETIEVTGITMKVFFAQDKVNTTQETKQTYLKKCFLMLRRYYI